MNLHLLCDRKASVEEERRREDEMRNATSSRPCLAVAIGYRCAWPYDVSNPQVCTTGMTKRLEDEQRNVYSRPSSVRPRAGFDGAPTPPT